MPHSPPPPPVITTRDDVIRAAERLRRAAQLLDRHVARCTDPAAAAHADALRTARGMVRAVVEAQEVAGDA